MNKETIQQNKAKATAPNPLLTFGASHIVMVFGHEFTFLNTFGCSSLNILRGFRTRESLENE